jgi:aryl-alcohol dehydrogenase-like predicted oxidoreductase
MIPMVRFGKTGLQVSKLGLGCFPFGAVNAAHGWNPYTPEGRAAAVATIHAALDAGINYLDTAASYGDGHSETIVGEALRGRRSRVILATKTGYHNLSAAEVTASVEASLRRLETDYIDIIQFHGGMYEPRDVDHLFNDGLLDALRALQQKGAVRFIGFTVEEPWTALPLIARGVFDVMQIRYNFIYQSAAHHALNDARRGDVGVAVMRPLTSGIMQHMAQYLAPDWPAAAQYEMALKFVLADSRVHVANVGMRWPAEVARNAALAESFRPPFDMADLPRSTIGVYKAEDAGVSG